MKWSSLFLSGIVIAAVSACIAQENPSVNVSSEAIDARIKAHRMGDLVIKAGPGAKVTVQQTRHEFLFGTAIPNALAEQAEDAMSPEDRAKYLEILEQNFNYAVHENALKWYDCEKEPGVVDYTVADRIWELCAERNIPMRGHCVFWAKDEFNLQWLKDLDSDALRGAVTRRGLDVVEHFKGRINEFDLNNEMVHGDFFRRRLGTGVVNEMAWIVKAANPDARLYVNDYAILDFGYNRGAFMNQVETFLKQGVPIDGIGCQAHKSMHTDLTVSAERTQRTLDRLTERFGLPIKITEALFAYEDEQVQVDELNKLFPVYFAHPNVEAVIIWGFWEKPHWQPHCAMWRTDWTPRPQAKAYRKLVFDKWWTEESGKTDKEGVFETRAFYGDYDITVDGVTQQVTLSRKDRSTEVVFD